MSAEIPVIKASTFLPQYRAHMACQRIHNPFLSSAARFFLFPFLLGEDCRKAILLSQRIHCAKELLECDGITERVRQFTVETLDLDTYGRRNVLFDICSQSAISLGVVLEMATVVFAIATVVAVVVGLITVFVFSGPFAWIPVLILGSLMLSCGLLSGATLLIGGTLRIIQREKNTQYPCHYFPQHFSFPAGDFSIMSEEAKLAAQRYMVTRGPLPLHFELLFNDPSPFYSETEGEGVGDDHRTAPPPYVQDPPPYSIA